MPHCHSAAPAAPAARREDRIAALACIVAFLAAIAVLRDQWVLVPLQSLHYVLAAGALARGDGFAVLPDEPFGRFAPLHALLLAPFAAAGVAPLVALRIVNAFAFAASLGAIHALARALCVRTPLLVMGLFAVFASNAYLLRAARPDGLFVAATLAALAAAIHYQRTAGRRALLAMAALCLVAWAARYIAFFTLIPVCAAVIGLRLREAAAGPGAGRRAVVIDAALFAAVVAGPAALWLARNRAVTGFALGMSRTAARVQARGQGPLDHASAIVSALFHDAFVWGAMGVRRVVHFGAPVSGRALSLGAAALGLCGVAFVGWRYGPSLSGCLRRAWRDAGSPERGAATVAAFAVVYAAALVVLWSTGNNDPINSRYVAPLHGCAIVLVAWLHAQVAARARRAAHLAFGALALLVVAANLPKTLELLGPTPDARLIESVTHGGVDRRLQTLDWDARALLRERRAASRARGGRGAARR